MSSPLGTIAITALSILSFGQSANASTVVTDDFNDGVFDTDKWNVSLPFSDSAFNESGGSLTLSNRAIISTRDQFSFPVTITGALMASEFEITRILTRSDLQIEDSYYHELTGLRFSFHYDSDIIQIQDSNHTTVAQKSYSFSSGEWYSFLITDDGSNVSWTINGVEELHGTSSYSGGGHVAFYNRNWDLPLTTSVDYFSIAVSPAPEPASTILPTAGFAAVVFLRRKRRQTPL